MVSPAPDIDEIEISVFGPGYGECIVLHLGGGNWFVVDSCFNSDTGMPVALEYLRKIDVDPGVSVKQIIATHWHDDHIRGLAGLFRECSEAQFVCSGAIASREFSTLVELFSSGAMMHSSGIDEFAEVLKLLRERERSAPKLAKADTCLWQSDFSLEGESLSCKIFSLAPSDQAVMLSLVELARLIPEAKLPNRRLFPESPNHLSVVLWVQVGTLSIVLGGDLQETGDSGIGWSAILSDSAIKNSWHQSPGKASFFKIPHHGSQNGDCAGVWAEMLQSNPIAVLTPFAKQRLPLPTQSDVKRICNQTDQAYSTSVLRRREARKRNKAVDRTIREAVGKLYQVHPPMGQVRCRAKFSGDSPGWETSLMRSAIPLGQLYTA